MGRSVMTHIAYAIDPSLCEAPEARFEVSLAAFHGRRDARDPLVSGRV